MIEFTIVPIGVSSGILKLTMSPPERNFGGRFTPGFGFARLLLVLTETLLLTETFSESNKL